MSSLVRRTVRTTAAAAGIAVLGAGLAGNAVAAPAADAGAPAPETASALTGMPAAVPLADPPSAPALPSLADLPMLFVFEGPTVNTAGPSSTPAPSSTRLPDVRQLPGSDQVPGLDAAPVPTTVVPTGVPGGGVDAVALPVSGTAADRSTAAAAPAAHPAPSSPDRVGALSALDSRGLFDGLAQERLVDQQGAGTSIDRVGGLG